MNKKRIFAIITFIVLGLFMFAFANPLNDNGEDNNANQAATGNTSNESTEQTNNTSLPETDNNETARRNATRTNTRRAINNTNANETTVALNKLIAIDELTKYRNDFQFEDDTAYKKVIEDYTDKINNSTTLDEIENNLNEGKDKVDELISEDLTAYKEAAKKNIKEYAESLNLVTDYTDLLDDYNKKIDNSTAKKFIDELVDNAKKALDEMKANEVAKAKEKALKDINEYKQEDQEYIKDIEATKEEGIKEVEASNDVKEIENVVEETKNKIDDLIKNTTFTVKFYNINTHNFNYELIDTQTIHYTKTAKTPEIKKEVKTFYGRVINKFVGWSEDFTEVKTNLDVYANYEVTKVTGSAYVVKEASSNKERLTTDDYEEIEKNIEVKLTDDIIKAVNTYSKGHEVIVATDDTTIRSIVSTKLPTLYKDNKYKTIEFYVLKVTGNGVHVDGRIHYDKEAELADKKADAIDEIRKYRTDDEEYIEEITTIKDESIENINELDNLKDIDKAVKEAKKAIDDAIKNKKFKVTFVGKGGLTTTVSVGYKKDAHSPKTSDFTIPTYRNVTYKLTGWDKKYKNVKSDITVNGKYKITKVVATVFLLDEKNEIPENKEAILYGKYTKFKTVELKATKAVKEAIKNDKDAVVLTSDKDIRSTLVESNSLPDVVNKYKNYEFYVMKFCENSEAGFHIDGKLHYNKEAELTDKKAEAIEEIKKYKAEDEEYINEITTIKKDFNDKLDKINNLDDLKKSVDDTKKAIDDAIANKKFTVTFYGIKGKVLSTQSVTYNTAANIPDTSGTITEWNGSIKLKFSNWDVKDSALKHVKGNLEVQAKYDVVSATTKISILKEDLGYDYSTNIDDFNHPYNKPEVEKDKYFELTITKEIVEAVNNYRNEHIIVYSDNDKKIREVLKDEPDVFNNNKYKKLQYYVLKLQGDRFHCDARVIYDKEREKLDKAKEELQELIDKAKKLDTTDKTKDSVEELNNKISKAEENIKGNDIDAINESIKELKDIKLVDIKVTALHVKVNKDKYFDYETEFDITVTYDDNNGKKGVVTDDYKVTAFDKAEGKHTATVTYKGQSEKFEYTTVINKIESIKVVNNVAKYWKNQKEDITVTATYTDNTTKELASDKYRLNNFKTTSETTKRTATVVLNSNNNIIDTFDYAVSKYSSKDEEDEAIEAERKKLITNLNIEVNRISIGNYEVRFKNYNKKITVKSMHRIGNINDYEVTLKSTDVDGVFKIDLLDFANLRITNSDTFDQYIYIKYDVDGHTYTAKYREEDQGKIKFVSFI